MPLVCVSISSPVLNTLSSVWIIQSDQIPKAPDETASHSHSSVEPLDPLERYSQLKQQVSKSRFSFHSFMNMKTTKIIHN